MLKTAYNTTHNPSTQNRKKALLGEDEDLLARAPRQRHATAEQQADMVVTLDAPQPMARNTDLLPRRRGTLPSRPGSKGAAPSDGETFTLEQRGGAAYRTTGEGPHRTPPSDGHINAASNFSRGSPKQRRESLGAATEHEANTLQPGHPRRLPQGPR
jgi:hypothetical protein